jgi:hypothetical protein
MDHPNADNSSITPPKEPSKALMYFKRIVYLFLTIVVLIVGSGFFIGYFYQDEVKEYIVGELNKQLNTEIIIEGKDIDFTVIKNFPYASVDFKNVKALDAIQRKNKDTLFKAGKISFQFNIRDIFNKNYHIKKIEIEDVDLKISIYKNGNDNYHFWKASTDSSNTAFSFALEKIEMKQIHVLYKNHQSKLYVDVQIKKSDFSGAFATDNYSMETATDLWIESVKTDKTIFLKQKDVTAEIVLNVENKTSSYKINHSKIKIENLLFELVGNTIIVNEQPIVNIGVKGKDMDIKSVLSLIPEKYKGEINNYESTGEFYFDATIQGTWAENQTPEVRADFGINNADITQVKDDIVLHHVKLKGNYFNGIRGSEVSSFSLSSFSATIEQGSISGELFLKNLENPSFRGKIIADISLEKLQRFVKIDTIESVTGQLKINALYSGDGKSVRSGNYENISTSGDLTILDMNMKLKNNILEFSKINGDFKFDDNDLIVNGFNGNVSSSDFELKGTFQNIINYFLKPNEDILVDATFKSNYMNLNEVLANKAEDSNSKEKYKLTFSEHINANLNTEIKHLAFRKFDATNISGTIKLQDKKMMIDPVSFSTMNGSILTSGMVDGSDSTQLRINCFSDITKINITKLFEQFENFGQTSITDKNIKGVASLKVQLVGVLSPELDMDLNKLFAAIDMTIENGELKNVESMKSLSRFIELNELETVRFATLKNQIEIKNQQISIPKMEVKSTAINIIASGSHSFNNDINYKVKLSLNELLSKKAKAAKKQNDEFGEIADDGLGRTNIFLSMTGTVDNPIIKYDTKSALQNVKQDLKVEKQTLKTILNEEFGLFKKDTSLNHKRKVEDTKMIIKFNEQDKKEVKKELKKPKKEEGEDF